ncbi:major facilitator superfamily domain-containing protein [Penicillium malachiteum]|nr:major facilitator superfamily domain-containing protein [Penicillium malachiteum]
MTITPVGSDNERLTQAPIFQASLNPGEKLPCDLKTSPTSHIDSIDYPEGGREAWLVVLGAFCGLAASLGIYNTIGVFDAIISKEILPNVPSSTMGWVFSVYAFIVWICGVQIGPTFDAMGPKALMLTGSICTLIGIFSMSFCKDLPSENPEYYQLFLAFSILTGIGSSLLITPSMACVAHWFMKRRGLASGIAFVGSGVGGVIFPLMLQALLPRVGWAWSIRILGFALLMFCSIALAFCRSRVPPRKGSDTTWRDTLPDPSIFLDRTGALAITTTGVLFTDLAYFIPITYMPSYFIDRQHLSQEEVITGSAAFAYQLLTILNAASCGGRYIAGDLADRFGRYNTRIVSLFFCIVSILGFWLPDIALPGIKNDALLIIFVVLFGFFSGSNISLLPICLGQLCETQDYGRYYASCFTVVSFGVLASLPIAGDLLNAVSVIRKERYWGLALFAGLNYVLAFLCFLCVRIRINGCDWRTVW